MKQENESWREQIQKGLQVEPLSSWENFVEFVKDEKECWPTLIFRGQANAEWKLLSRLDRLEKNHNTKPNLNGPGEFLCPRVERDIHLKRFRELALDKIDKDVKNNDVLWTIAQHHGLATPLLDFTYSPFVALFFAFEEEKCWCKENDTAVFKEPHKRAVFALTYHLLDTSGKIDETKSKTISELVRPFSAAGYGNYRAVSQAGVFLKMPAKKYPDKWDLESYIQEKHKNETYKESSNENANLHPNVILRKFEIPKKERIKCLKFLDQMNINRAALFPDLDGVAKYINDLWETNFDKALGYIEQL